jgi:hypothetical protein
LLPGNESTNDNSIFIEKGWLAAYRSCRKGARLFRLLFSSSLLILSQSGDAGGQVNRFALDA